MKRTLEVNYQQALLGRVSLAYRDHRFFRRNVGAIRVDDRFFRASIPGQCDLYILGRGGWHGECEIKRYTKLSDAQEKWRAWCQSWAVPWICLEVRKTEIPPETLDRWMQELSAWLGCTGSSAAAEMLHTTGT